MGILWCGGEDTSMMEGDTITMRTDYAAGFRSAWSRGAIRNIVAGGYTKLCISLPFPGGAVTSAWFAAQITAAWDADTVSPLSLGLGKTGTLKGIFLGFDGTAGNRKITISKYDGATVTVLATSASGVVNQGVIHRYDVHLASYGGGSQIDVYMDGSGVAAVSFSGDCSISGVSDLDVVMMGPSADINHVANYTSEIIVSSTDTRGLPGLRTLGPSAAGDTNGWTGAYTDIDEAILSDVDVIYVNTNDADFECNLLDCPAGVYAVDAVMIECRAQKTADSTPTKVGIGVKTNTTIDVDAGHALTNLTWKQFSRLMTTNPVTTSIWNTDEINALQINLRALA